MQDAFLRGDAERGRAIQKDLRADAAGFRQPSPQGETQMKWVAGILVTGIIAVVVAVRPSNIHAQTETPQHARGAFELTVHAPFQQAVALFGAHGERLWGGKDWDPQFIYPQPEEDRAGAVFTVANE